MKKYFSFVIVIVILVFANSCETDFTTIAPYEDITIVYGILDSKEAVQYVKINKAFLSETDVLTYALEPDSNQYLYKLEVAIEERSESGDLLNTYVLDTTTIYDKEYGQFYAPEQVLYQFDKTGDPYEIKYIIEGLNDTIGIIYFYLNEESTYKLKIKNPESGKEITAETDLVKDFRILKPGFGLTIRFVPDPIAPMEFEWEKADNGAKYEFELRFNYGEWKWGSQDTTYKYIVLASSSVSGPPGGNTLSYYYNSADFFTSCDILIPYSDPAEEEQVRERYSSKVDVIVSVAETEFAKYMEVNEPSTGIIQEKPNYTNIDNGLGIYSSRLQNIKTKKLHPESVIDLKKMYPELKFKY